MTQKQAALSRLKRLSNWKQQVRKQKQGIGTQMASYVPTQCENYVENQRRTCVHRKQDRPVRPLVIKACCSWQRVLPLPLYRLTAFGAKRLCNLWLHTLIKAFPQKTAWRTFAKQVITYGNPFSKCAMIYSAFQQMPSAKIDEQPPMSECLCYLLLVPID